GLGSSLVTQMCSWEVYMRLKSLMFTGFVAAVSLVTANLVFAGATYANTLVFDLTSDHCGGGTPGCLPDGGSSGTVTITDVSGGVSVSVALDSAYRFVHTGFDTDFGFNLANNPTITYSGVSSGFTPTGANPQSASGGLHMDGTGNFEYGVTC